MSPSRSLPLVVLCAGRNSLHCVNRWHCSELRAFELWLVVYDGTDTFAADADAVWHVRGTKSALIRHMAELIRGNDRRWTWFPDDDLAIDVLQVNAFFETCRDAVPDARETRALIQPAVGPRYASHAALIHDPTYDDPTRAVSFVEIQMPCISAALLPEILQLFLDTRENQSGWGLDLVWSSWPGVTKLVVNDVVATHTKPVSSASAHGPSDPLNEQRATLRKYSLL